PRRPRVLRGGGGTAGAEPARVGAAAHATTCGGGDPRERLRTREAPPCGGASRSSGGGGRHCPGVRGTPSRCLLRAFPSESDLGDRFGQSAGYVPGAIPSKLSRDGRGSDRRGEPAD